MVRIIYNKARYIREIKLSEEGLKYFKEKNIKSVALFASIQFLELDKLKEQLKDAGVEVLTTKAKKAGEEGQIIGCSIYKENFEKDIIRQAEVILYIGDGMFHPTALLFSQIGEKIKPVVIYNPISESMRLIDEKEIESRMNKMQANLRKFISSQTIGILISIKPGQQHLLMAEKLKERLENRGKKVYLFVDDRFNFENLENFNFIECWVNTACPRIGTEDIINAPKSLVNICDALNPIEAIEKMKSGK